MSQDRHHSRTGHQSHTDHVNHVQGHTDHPSTFVSGHTDGDSIVQSLSHATSSGTVELQFMQTGLQRLQLDYQCDPAYWDPRPEADSKPLVLGTSQQERILRRKPKCGDLRAKAAYQATMEELAQAPLLLFVGPGSRAVNNNTPQQRRDPPNCVVPDPCGHGTDPQDGRRTRRGHRTSERPLSASPSPNTLIGSQVEVDSRNKSNHDPRYAPQVSQQDHSKPVAQAASQHRTQRAGFLTSQEWQQYPTTYGPGSPYGIARTLRRTTQAREPIVHAEEESDSDASTLVAEKRFNPIAGLEGFDGVPAICGEGYHYPRMLFHSSTPTPEETTLMEAVIEGVLCEDCPAEETLLQNVPAQILSAGNVARVRRGYPASAPPTSAGSGDGDAQQKPFRARVLESLLIPAFEEYSTPAVSRQRHSVRMTKRTSFGLRQLALSLRECLFEIDWQLSWS